MYCCRTWLCWNYQAVPHMACASLLRELGLLQITRPSCKEAQHISKGRRHQTNSWSRIISNCQMKNSQIGKSSWFAHSNHWRHICIMCTVHACCNVLHAFKTRRLFLRRDTYAVSSLYLLKKLDHNLIWQPHALSILAQRWFSVRADHKIFNFTVQFRWISREFHLQSWQV